MTAHLTRRLLAAALAGGYAVPAFNVVDELGVDAVLATAARLRSPVVVQMSARTARFWRPRPVRAAFAARRAEHGAVAVLHLDHCADPGLVGECLSAGWESALFDASHLSFADAVRTTAAVVADARRFGADIEGEFEPIGRADDADGPHRTDEDDDRCDEFVAATAVAALSPDLGTRHGDYATAPRVDTDRAAHLAERLRLPLVLHGGTGLASDDVRAFVRAGVAKVNVSSAVKAVHLRVITERAQDTTEPLELLGRTRTELAALFEHHIRLLGSDGRAPCRR